MEAITFGGEVNKTFNLRPWALERSRAKKNSTWHNLVATLENHKNAFSSHFTKKITMVAYGIGIGYVKCHWKGIVKYHLVSQKR